MNDQGKYLLHEAVTCDLALIITISDASKIQPKWIDTDDQINVSRLIV
jgi:hypothetical protein